jgi:hypothetical protein
MIMIPMPVFATAALLSTLLMVVLRPLPYVLWRGRTRAPRTNSSRRKAEAFRSSRYDRYILGSSVFFSQRTKYPQSNSVRRHASDDRRGGACRQTSGECRIAFVLTSEHLELLEPISKLSAAVDAL